MLEFQCKGVRVARVLEIRLELKEVAAAAVALSLAQWLGKPVVAGLSPSPKLSRNLSAWSEAVGVYVAGQWYNSVVRYTGLVAVAQHHKVALPFQYL